MEISSQQLIDKGISLGSKWRKTREPGEVLASKIAEFALRSQLGNGKDSKVKNHIPTLDLAFPTVRCPFNF